VKTITFTIRNYARLTMSLHILLLI